MVMICTPFSPARAAATRAMCPASFVWTTTVLRWARAAFIAFTPRLSPRRPFSASGGFFQRQLSKCSRAIELVNIRTVFVEFDPANLAGSIGKNNNVLSHSRARTAARD